MSHSNGQLIRTLQQEKIRLEKAQAVVAEEAQGIQRFIDMLADLYWAAQKIEWEDNIRQALDPLHYRTLDTVGVKDGSISILDERTNELVFWIVQGQVRHQLAGFRIPSDAGVAGWVIESNLPVIINYARQDWRFSMQVDEAFSFSTHSILCVPILKGEQAIGVIQLLNKHQQQPFNEVDITLATVLSDVVAKGVAELRLRSFEQPHQAAVMGGTSEIARRKRHQSRAAMPGPTTKKAAQTATSPPPMG